MYIYGLLRGSSNRLRVAGLLATFFGEEPGMSGGGG
jgi:hypothetical protein